MCTLRSFRDCIIRFYWDDEIAPLVEIPYGSFPHNSWWKVGEVKFDIDGDIFVKQLKIGLIMTELAIEMAYSVILNLAPARLFPSKLLKKVLYFTPNESEVE